MKDRDDEDEDWAEETTEEAQRRRMEEISDHAKNLTLSDDLERPLEERVDLFYDFVKVSSFRLHSWLKAFTSVEQILSDCPWTVEAGAVH